MMKNLRKGNWILDHEGIPREVAYVTKEGVIGLHNDIGGVQKYQYNPVFSGNINDLNAIVLELCDIEKVCGFEPFCGCDFMKGDFKIFAGHHEYWWGWEKNENVRLNYLHQLQNKYQDETGEELEIKWPEKIKTEPEQKKWIKIMKTIWFVLLHLRSVSLAIYYSIKEHRTSLFMIYNGTDGLGYNHSRIKRKLDKYRHKAILYNERIKYLDKLWNHNQKK